MPKSLITAIKAHFNLAPYVSPYTSGLKSSKRGFFLGQCPIHKSNNPREFWVNTNGQTCGCFVPTCPAYCNRAADPSTKPLDIINIKMLLDGCTFTEAVTDLAKEAGLI